MCSIANLDGETEEISASSLRILVVHLKVRGVLSIPTITTLQSIEKVSEINSTDMFKQLLESIDGANEKSANSTQAIMCSVIKSKFQAKTMTEVFSSFTGVQKEVCLMILLQVFPNLADDLNSLSKLSLQNFKLNSQIESYLDAVIKSGIAADVDQGIVFLLGNTGVGKTSLTHTLKDFIEKPTDNPKSILAGIGEYKKPPGDTSSGSL